MIVSFLCNLKIVTRIQSPGYSIKIEIVEAKVSSSRPIKCLLV